MTKREEKVVAYVNRMLKQYRSDLPPIIELPMGRKRLPNKCPIALALHCKFVGMSSFKYGNRPPVTMPLYVQDFIEDFDDGRFPHLEKGAKV